MKTKLVIQTYLDYTNDTPGLDSFSDLTATQVLMFASQFAEDPNVIRLRDGSYISFGFSEHKKCFQKTILQFKDIKNNWIDAATQLPKMRSDYESSNPVLVKREDGSISVDVYDYDADEWRGRDHESLEVWLPEWNPVKHWAPLLKEKKECN